MSSQSRRPRYIPLDSYFNCGVRNGRFAVPVADFPSRRCSLRAGPVSRRSLLSCAVRPPSSAAATAGNLSSLVVRHTIKGKHDDPILCFLDAVAKIPGSGLLSVVGGSGAGSYTRVTNLGGGTRNVWNRGDAFVITNGYPGLDQIGRAPGTEVVEGATVQKSEPLYAWGNTLDGASLSLTAESMGIRTFPRISDHVREGWDFFNKSKAELGYKPYVYPHPLAAKP